MLSNRLRLFKRRVSIIYDIFLRKGYEHVTIMLIPHSEKNIFTFKISNFMFLFFTLIVFVLVVGGSYLFVDRTTFEEKVSDLNDNYIESLSVLEGIKTNMHLLSNASNQVLDVTKNIIDIIHPEDIQKKVIYNDNHQGGPLGKNPFLDFFSTGNVKGKIDKERLKEIKKLLFLGKDLSMVHRDLKGLEIFLKNYKTILKQIPSIFPVLGSSVGRGYITSYYGLRRDPFSGRMTRHFGIDIVNLHGTPVISTANGYVKNSGYNPSKGLFVEVYHKYGFSTNYFHLSSIYVRKGQNLSKGQVIGRIGSTGRSTGSHLHYEIRINNFSINPLPFMNLDRFHEMDI
uniref:Peptidase M23 n=1 Tax=uncultured spirochete TaxID=156406 RepID=A0A224ATY0_9SPIR|nr:peptidase M23 [uncultured spirochete]